ncbi:SDR family NAD(P)-dependent oxidoreductase [Galactobacter valiniphilus]|uniref:SDR family NAD(P)-dependent oxidoreductase n=1 Tax=Galactobacter valiniphilus TaxID=2676122 RepID=UPI0037356CD8
MNTPFDIESTTLPALSGRTVVIPGGTGGVGEGIVRTWLRSGATVVVPTRSLAKGEALRELLGEDGRRETLHFVEGAYGTFDEAEALAARVAEGFGSVTDVVASIGGWWVGDGLWSVDEADWHRYFLDLVTAHVGFIRAFYPALPANGTYSLILGGSAYTPVPGSSIISMEQAALRMMNAVAGQEAGAERAQFHALIMGPVGTRQRSYIDEDMITADEVGFVSAAYAAAGSASGEAILRDHEDVTRELGVAGFQIVSTRGEDASRVPAAWPELPAELGDAVVVPGESRYQRVRSSYMAVGHPGAVVMARTEDDVAQAVDYAARLREATGERVPFSVRSGGHGIAGTSTNTDGVVVDLSALKRIQVIDPESGLVQVQAGAIWGDVAAALAPLDLVLTSGNMGDTGVGGLATAGGLGYFARSQGMTLDRIERVRVLTADGQIRWVDATTDPELFWAVRGGATQAGIALDFVFRAQPLHTRAGNASVVHQGIQYLVDDLPRFTRDWGDWISQAPRELESFLMVQAMGGGRFAARATNVWAGDDTGAATPTLRSALDLAGVMEQNAQVVPYAHVVPTPRSPHLGQQRIHMRDVLVDHANEEAGEAMAQALAHEATAVGELRALGGAVADVAVEDTAWAGRTQELLMGTWVHPGGLAAEDESFAPMQAIGTGTYGAYSSDTRPAAAELAWPGATGERLRAVSDRVDPERLFDRGLVLPKLPVTAGA